MQITDLSITNLKGLTLKEKIGPNTLITGKNFSGKTARLQAIQLAILGYIPGLPKTNPGIFQLASGNPLEVHVQGRDFEILRTWKKTGKSVEKSAAVSGLPDDTGPLIAMLDAQDFLAASEPERLNMIFRLATIKTEETPETILQKLPTTEDFKPLSMIYKDGKMLEVREWLEEALTYALEQRKYTKQAVDRLDKTQQGMEALEAAQDAPTIPEGLEAAIKALEASKRPLEARQTELTTLARVYQDVLKRYERDKLAYGHNLESRKRKQALVTTKKTVEEQLKAAQEKLKQEGPDSDVEAIRRGYQGTLRAEQEASNEVRIRQSGLDAVSKELDELKELECCPHCHSKSKGWRKFLEEGLEAKYNAARLHLETALEDEKRATKVRINTEKNLEDAKAHHDRIAALELEIGLTRGTLKSIQEAEEDLAVEPSEPVAPVSPDDSIEEEMRLERELEEIDEELRVKQALVTQGQQAKARAATAAQAVLAAKKAREEKEAWIKAVDILEESRQQMIDDAFAELLKIASPVYEGILQTPLAYLGGVLGRPTPAAAHGFVPLTAFSGTEALVATIALQVALGAKSPAKIVLLDEMGRLDVENKNRLIGNLHGMVNSGQLHQWIAIDVSAPSKKHPDFTLIAA